jgi:hypothetical protein
MSLIFWLMKLLSLLMKKLISYVKVNHKKINFWLWLIQLEKV